MKTFPDGTHVKKVGTSITIQADPLDKALSPVEEARLEAGYRLLIEWYELVLANMSDGEKQKLLTEQHTADSAAEHS